VTDHPVVLQLEVNPSAVGVLNKPSMYVGGLLVSKAAEDDRWC